MPIEMTMDRCLDLVCGSEHKAGLLKLLEKDKGEWYNVAETWELKTKNDDQFVVTWLPTPGQNGDVATLIFCDKSDFHTVIAHSYLRYLMR